MDLIVYSTVLPLLVVVLVVTYLIPVEKMVAVVVAVDIHQMLEDQELPDKDMMEASVIIPVEDTPVVAAAVPVLLARDQMAVTTAVMEEMGLLHQFQVRLTRIVEVEVAQGIPTHLVDREERAEEEPDKHTHLEVLTLHIMAVAVVAVLPTGAVVPVRVIRVLSSSVIKLEQSPPRVVPSQPVVETQSTHLHQLELLV